MQLLLCITYKGTSSAPSGCLFAVAVIISLVEACSESGLVSTEAKAT
jgi:hypothetical protein